MNPEVGRVRSSYIVVQKFARVLEEEAGCILVSRAESIVATALGAKQSVKEVSRLRPSRERMRDIVRQSHGNSCQRVRGVAARKYCADKSRREININERAAAQSAN